MQIFIPTTFKTKMHQDYNQAYSYNLCKKAEKTYGRLPVQIIKHNISFTTVVVNFPDLILNFKIEF